MTIQRSYGEIEFHCDAANCHEVLECETKSWQQALADFEESGWAFRTIRGEPLHICPDCLEAETGKAL